MQQIQRDDVNKVWTGSCASAGCHFKEGLSDKWHQSDVYRHVVLKLNLAISQCDGNGKCVVSYSGLRMGLYYDGCQVTKIPRRKILLFCMELLTHRDLWRRPKLLVSQK